MRLRSAVLATSTLVLLAVACGKKGPPLAPLAENPQAVSQLQVGQEGDQLLVAFMPPQTTLQGAKLGSVEIDLVIAKGDERLDQASASHRVAVPAGQYHVERLPLPPSGTTLRVIARARAKGSRSLASNMAMFTTQSPAAPPSAVVATNDPAGVLIVWVTPAPTAAPTPDPRATPDPRTTATATRPPSASGYVVRRRIAPGEPTTLTVRPIAGPPYVDDAAPAGQKACYTVRRIASSDPLVQSAETTEVCVDVKDVRPPLPPAGVALLPTSGALVLSWSPATDADVVGYRVYRAEGGSTPQKVAELSPTERTFRDTKVAPSVRYRYTVTAVDAAGNESAPGGSVEATLP